MMFQPAQSSELELLLNLLQLLVQLRNINNNLPAFEPWLELNSPLVRNCPKVNLQVVICSYRELNERVQDLRKQLYQNNHLMLLLRKDIQKQLLEMLEQQIDLQLDMDVQSYLLQAKDLLLNEEELRILIQNLLPNQAIKSEEKSLQYQPNSSPK